MEKLKLWKRSMMANKSKRTNIFWTKRANRQRRSNRNQKKPNEWLNDYCCFYFWNYHFLFKIVLLLLAWMKSIIGQRICYFFRKANTFGKIVYLRALRSSPLKLLRTYPATMSGSFDLGLSIPRCSLLKSFPPIEAMIDLIPLCPLKIIF